MPRKWDFSPRPDWSDPSQVNQTRKASSETRLTWKLWKISFSNEFLLNTDRPVIRIEISMKTDQTFSISIGSKTFDTFFDFQGSFHIYSEIIIRLSSRCDFLFATTCQVQRNSWIVQQIHSVLIASLEVEGIGRSLHPHCILIQRLCQQYSSRRLQFERDSWRITNVDRPFWVIMRVSFTNVSHL